MSEEILPPPLSTLYTLGYSGWTRAGLAGLVTRLGAQLVDIRYAAKSSRPEWGGKALREAFGERYLHLGCLGNRRYKDGPPIELDNPAAAVEPIRQLLEHHPVILVCQCVHVMECHRLTAARYLMHEIRGLQVSHLPTEERYRPPRPPQPAGAKKKWSIV